MSLPDGPYGAKAGAPFSFLNFLHDFIFIFQGLSLHFLLKLVLDSEIVLPFFISLVDIASLPSQLQKFFSKIMQIPVHNIDHFLWEKLVYQPWGSYLNAIPSPRQCQGSMKCTPHCTLKERLIHIEVHRLGRQNKPENIISHCLVMTTWPIIFVKENNTTKQLKKLKY